MKKSINMGIRGKISKIELAYIAGLFDGEGHIFITRDKRPHYKTPVHILRVGITNTNREIIEWIHRLFPAIWQMRVRFKNHPKWKPCFFWETNSKKALYFLKLIYPYLRIKKKQVKLGIQFQEKWRDRRFSKKRKILKTSQYVLNAREKYRLAIEILNKKKSPAETKRDDT